MLTMNSTFDFETLPLLEKVSTSTLPVASADPVLPIYLVVDVSMSMAESGRIDEANAILPSIKTEVEQNPALGSRIRVGLISFADDAVVEMPLSDPAAIDRTSLPVLTVRGATNYSNAFRLLSNQIYKNCSLLQSQGFSVLRPFTFFLTDGSPVEDEAGWKLAYEKLHHPPCDPNVFAIGIGKDCDRSILGWIAENQRGGALPFLIAHDEPYDPIKEYIQRLLLEILQRNIDPRK